MGLMTGLLIAGVGAQLYGSYKASQAAKKASSQQAASADKALAVQQQMYQQTRGDLAPYRQYGAGALAAGHQLMGLPTPAAEPMVPLSQVGQPGGGGMVQLRAPTGQMKAVPANQVDYYLARGATRG